ncbi:hypothetical protein D6D13_05882 [Aureobasidium pullulans]|uniref:histidine kinase n=1 Tax=Aureobasidium pullulans TaxID=5580 RepID=A0A4S9CQV1_AURPU|nr:hypothetical protein D6D13_05882 [Aureobasidium pullulans]
MASEGLLEELPLELKLLVQLAIDDNRPTCILDSTQSQPTCLFQNAAFQHALAHIPSDALNQWLSTETSSTCSAKATPAGDFADREWIKKELGTSYVVIYCKHKFVPPPRQRTEDNGLDSLVHDWIKFPDQVPTNNWIRYLMAYDWSQTDIGALYGSRMHNWPAALRATLQTYMHYPHPVLIYWGADLIQIYNEPTTAVFGNKHPGALGNKSIDTWDQVVRDQAAGLIKTGWEQGQSVHVKETLFLLDREGFLEESYFDGFFLPIVGPDGYWTGCANLVNEVTSQVFRNNREDVSRNLLQRTVHAPDLPSLWLEFLGILDEEADDIAYTLLFMINKETTTPTGEKYFLYGSSGLKSNGPFEKSSAKLKSALEIAEQDENVVCLQDESLPVELKIVMPELGTVASAFVFTIFDIKGSALGSVVIGVNPRRRADDYMKKFIYSLNEILLRAVTILDSPFDQRKILRTDDSFGYRISLAKLSRELNIATLKNEKSQETFTRMAEDAPIGMFLYKGDGTPLYLNDRFLELLGEKRDEYFEKAKTGYAWRDCIHPDDEEFSKEAWRYVAESHSVLNFQFRVKAGTKSSPTRARWLEVVCFPQRDSKGVLVTFQGYLTDVTSKKLTEALTTERMNAAIETKRQAQNFIDMISHEMRNPLSSIIQLTESILSTSLDATPAASHETVIDAANTINICAFHMLQIINEVLDFSKLDSNLLVLAPERTRPREVVEKALKMFETELKSADIMTKVEQMSSDCAVADVMCDPSRLLQVIINLITNALKFTRSAEIRRITLSYGTFFAPPSALDCGVEFVKPRKKDHDDPETATAMLAALDSDDSGDDVYLLFSVEDTGCGLTPEESQLLFQRFSQAPKTYKQYGGSGLGLFISRELVELQQGKIGLHSEAGAGSRFAFYIKAKRAVRASRSGSVASVGSTVSVKNLPHAMGGAFDEVKVLEKVDTVPQPKTLVHDMHVLIVEDNEINCKVMSKQLRKLGCEVNVAGNGLEALNFLSTTTHLSSTSDATPLNLILLDIEMPVMDGLTCIRRIRALEQSGEISGHIPVIAITANARNEQIASAIEAGMDSVVTKPFKIKDLVPQMEAVVDSWSGAG